MPPKKKPDPLPFDVRQGLTSASNAEADLLCPGRHLAQRGLTSSDSKDAASGTLVHAAFAGTMEAETLSGPQRKTVERGKVIEQYVALNWFDAHGDDLAGEGGAIEKRAHRELRLWAYLNGQKIHSGGIDALWLAGNMKYALIEDLKSLFGDIEDAASNQQLRDYAALVYLNYGCEQVSVFINQPNVRWKLEDQKLITYEAADLERAAKEMKERVLASQKLDAPRVPGKKQCNFCLAAGTSRCPESLSVVSEFSWQYKDSWAFWEPSRRGSFIDTAKTTVKLAEKALDVAKSELKKDPSWAEGWRVTDDQAVRSVESAAEAVEALTDAFADCANLIREDIAASCKLSITDLEAIHAKYSKADTAEDRRAEFKVLFGHLIKTSTRSGSLKEVKVEKAPKKVDDEVPF